MPNFDIVFDWLLIHGTRIVLIIVLGYVLWKILQKYMQPLVARTMVKTKGDSERGIQLRTKTLVGIMRQTSRIVITTIVVLMVLTELGISVGPVIAGLGVVGLAVGFGGQYMIRDIIAGAFIIWENQYRVGDVARIADVAGLVEEVTIRKTVLRDLDGIVHHIPNGEVRVASNFTRTFSRVNLNVSVSYDTDLEKAISIINRVGNDLAEDSEWKAKIISPPQVLRVDNFGDSGIEIKVLGDTKPIEQWAVMGEFRLRIKKAFDAEGIEIPWPHTKVYFGNSIPQG